MPCPRTRAQSGRRSIGLHKRIGFCIDFNKLVIPIRKEVLPNEIEKPKKKTQKEKAMAVGIDSCSFFIGAMGYGVRARCPVSAGISEGKY